MPTLDVKTWLRNRMQGKQVTPREVTDDALAKGYNLGDLLTARKILGITASPDASGTIVWSLPTTPTQLSEARVIRADQYPSEPAAPKKRDLVPKRPENPPFSPAGSLKGHAGRRTPEDAVKLAQRLIKRRAPTAARYLRQLAEQASADAPACPACGRGMPRDEELRLKAVNGLLDRAGLSAAKAGTVGDDAGGPLIVFPPGTRIAVLAQMPEAEEEPGRGEMRVTRGDRLEPTGQMPKKVSSSPEEERS